MDNDNRIFINLLPRLFVTIGLAFNLISGVAGIPLILTGLILAVVFYKKYKEKEGLFSLLFSIISFVLTIIYIILMLILN